MTSERFAPAQSELFCSHAWKGISLLSGIKHLTLARHRVLPGLRRYAFPRLGEWLLIYGSNLGWELSHCSGESQAQNQPKAASMAEIDEQMQQDQEHTMRRE
jgi:hypothetical protein